MHLYYTEWVLIMYVYTVHTHTLPSGRNPKYHRVFSDQLCFLKKIISDRFGNNCNSI